MSEPASTIATAVTPATEEVRLATTMTGGVSLAVWMGGVARELDLLMQASKTRRDLQPESSDQPAPTAPTTRGTLSAAEAAQRDLYAGLLELLDIVVEIDVLSGTSAGGINAVMLAYVRARGGDLGQLREVWLELGALLDLLRNPTDADVSALLYGDRRMFAELCAQLPKLAPVRRAEAAPSTTLYVTTTLLSPESSRFTDAIGTQVQDGDQHGLFTFTEKDLLSKGIEGALALAARSTASFPGAFEPSFVPFENPSPAAGEVPPRPAMGRYANITRDHWVVDGGLLDNQPLDVLLERIFDRRARRPVRRVLLYVVPSTGPSPDLAEAGPSEQLTKPYGLLDGLLKDLSAATSQSISADLRAIVTHNDRISSRRDLRNQLAALANRLAGARLLTPSLLDDYRRQEGEQQARILLKAMLQLVSTWPPQTAAVPLGIPVGWQPGLQRAGEAEQACRAAMQAALAGNWPRAVDTGGTPDQALLPTASAVLAQYGQSAYDNGKSLALAVLRLGYQLALDAADRQQLASLVERLHSAAAKPDRPKPADLAEASCTAAVQSGGTLIGAATSLAQQWTLQTAVDSLAWAELAAVLADAAGLLTRLAQPEPVGELSTYLNYLQLADPATDAATIAVRVFDLAIAERALLPVEIGPYQAVELVQLSADTGSVLTPGNTSAASKLTGLQFHHFGAFYKRSWRANDWLWGRLDAAGWLVHALLDPRRLRLILDQQPAGGRAAGLLDRLAGFGPLPLGADDDVPDRAALLAELDYLDDPSRPVPPGLPLTSIWLASSWQRLIAHEELPKLASVIIGQPGEQVDRSPATTRSWAAKVLEPGADLDALLKVCPVPAETFKTDLGSQLMVHTVAKAAATATAVMSSVQQVPAAVRPAVSTAHTIALAGYRVADAARARPRNLIIAGFVLLALGIAAASQSATLFGITGLLAAAVGGYLITFGTWQLSSRLLAALVAVTLTGAVGSLATPVVRRGLFGTSATDPGYLGRHLYWLADAWWHPLLLVGVLLLLLVLAGMVFSGTSRSRRN